MASHVHPRPKATPSEVRFAWQSGPTDSKIDAVRARPPRTIMADADIVRHDQGGVNARILARENKADFRRIEAASVKMMASFRSAEGKRMFVRYFNTLQLSAHFISVIARTRIDHADVAKVEAVMKEQMDKVGSALDKTIDGAEALFASHGIAAPATYDTLPLEVEVGVLSSFGLRYLELLGKLDQAMPLLQTLEIFRVVTTQDVDIERAGLKRKVRDVANGARSLATRMRRAMNALEAQRAVAGQVPSIGEGIPDQQPATSAEDEGGRADAPTLSQEGVVDHDMQVPAVDATVS
jgi:hypothetical protein